jgi:hypothetical protein
LASPGGCNPPVLDCGSSTLPLSTNFMHSWQSGNAADCKSAGVINPHRRFEFGTVLQLWGCSSNGRAADSKPDGWQFKSVHPRHINNVSVQEQEDGY